MKEALMKSINLKKYSFLILILFLLEIGFSCLLAGGFTLIREQLTLLLSAILITCLMALFTPPQKKHINYRSATSLRDLIPLY